MYYLTHKNVNRYYLQINEDLIFSMLIDFMLYVSKSKFFNNTDNYYYKHFYNKKYDNLNFTCYVNGDI